VKEGGVSRQVGRGLTRESGFCSQSKEYSQDCFFKNIFKSVGSSQTTHLVLCALAAVRHDISRILMLSWILIKFRDAAVRILKSNY